MKRSGTLRRTPMASRRTPVRKKNVKRRVSEFSRCYGSRERVAFVKSLRCAACGAAGQSDNAHLLGNGGMGRKGGYEEIGPLCRSCHTLHDEAAWKLRLRFPFFDAIDTAAETAALWQQYQGTR